MTNAEPLLICNDGSSLLTKYAVGRGLLYISAVPLDKNFSDLPLNALFAPIMYNMAITREYAPANAYVIGQQNMASVDVDLSSGEQVLRLKNDNAEFIPAQRKSGSSVNIFLDNPIEQAGFYSLIDPGNQTQSVFAMNYNRRESDLSFFSADDLQKLSAPMKIRVIQNSDRDLGSVITGQKLGLPLWKVAIMLALLFIAAEIALLRLWR